MPRDRVGGSPRRLRAVVVGGLGVLVGAFLAVLNLATPPVDARSLVVSGAIAVVGAGAAAVAWWSDRR